MTALPTLETERLILRPFVITDADTVQTLAGHPAVAATTLNIPHPYPDGAAEMWILGHADRAAEGSGYTLALTRKEDGVVVGAMSLMGVSTTARRAELGYWIGVPYWGQGYATEAGRAFVAWAFDALELNKVYARHMTNNPASGKVMAKIGMQYEGTMRQHDCKGGQFVDIAFRSILRSEFRPS